jgi:hypothetical protein
LTSKVPHGVICGVQFKTDGGKMECPLTSLVGLENGAKSIVGMYELGRVCDGTNWIWTVVLRNWFNVK